MTFNIQKITCQCQTLCVTVDGGKMLQSPWFYWFRTVKVWIWTMSYKDFFHPWVNQDLWDGWHGSCHRHQGRKWCNILGIFSWRMGQESGLMLLQSIIFIHFHSSELQFDKLVPGQPKCTESQTSAKNIGWKKIKEHPSLLNLVPLFELGGSCSVVRLIKRVLYNSTARHIWQLNSLLRNQMSDDLCQKH